MGYTQDELDDIQARWKLRFPPDLVELLREHRPLLGGPGSFDWILSNREDIQHWLEWPLESFWFDVEHTGIWWEEWGEKPATPGAQRERLNELFAAAPKLIPLCGHRYLPEEPYEAGNPVFSVYQTDVIYYGADLLDWIERERDITSAKTWPPAITKEIRFWSVAVVRNSLPRAMVLPVLKT
jgi:hypothetical protein